tara:strand:+ start:6081 stop:7409 length:1329 start_codon:yes stop_codon:yes gene_type:complete
MSTNYNIDIVPSNVASNAKVSFRGGNPVIQFIIGSQDRMLLGNSLRFTGKFRCLTASGQVSSSAEGTLAMSDKLGVYSCIDTLTIKSQRTGQTIESIRNYNRFLASYLPVTTSKEDNMGHMYESALILPNYASQQASVVNIPSGETTQNHFCMALPCGLFNGGEPIPLMDEAIGGLLVELHLAPDSQVFHSSASLATGLADSFYEFTDITLSAEVMEPDAQTLQQLKSRQSATYEYNSISSYYQTINSGNGIINFQLGLSRVLGVFANVVPASHINNIVYDGLATLYPTNTGGVAAPVKELFFTRNGTKFPIDFNITTLQQDYQGAFNEAAGDTTTPDSEIIRNYMNAIQRFAGIHRTSLRPQNLQYANSKNFDKAVPFGGCGWGIGVAMDTVSDQGVDFSTVNFGINLSLMLDTDSPQAFYMFAHAKNTLVFGPQGLQVIS